MKQIRTIMMVAVMFLGLATVARAQDAGQQGRGRNMSAMLFNGITLTTDQQAKVDSITAKYGEQMRAARAEVQNGGDREAAMTKIRDLRQKEMDEFKAVLTDDQKKVFDKNVEDMRSRMQNRGPGSL
ncbi:MAG TPA: hypothetical protein VJU87_12765 [Gemmatimonadaceae bacterium]|nr:hypothetical protein [Gemmatimonadaceae bacterium]